MKRNLLLLIFSFCQIISAQNLVMNPSFEKASSTPTKRGQFNYYVSSWETPNIATTDYFNTKSKKIGYKNSFGYQEAYHGNSYAGIYVYSSNNYREYIQSELDYKLIAGKKYEVSFWVSKAEKATHAVNNLQVLFSHKKLKFRSEENIKLNKLRFAQHHLHQFKIDSFLTNENDWIKVSKTIVASGFEKSFIIGNFNDNKTTELIGRNVNSKKAYAYYYIDAVKIELKSNLILNSFKSEKTYTFKNVLFDFDKAILLNQSIEELNQLSEHLKTHPELKIEIYGHTDNVGLKSRNKELSQQRAEAVSKYLIEKGLNKKRIKWFGYGAEQPKVKNDSDKNRALNRRVDFQLIEL